MFRLCYLPLACSVTILPFLSAAQARINLNDDVRMTLNNGVFLVIDNPNSNALSYSGSADGNIVSENETNRIRWNIGASAGVYTIPFRSSAVVSDQGIPYTLDITSAGTGNGFIDFSTFETATDLNTPYPSMVTHMLDAATATVNNALFVADRFWIINAQNYTVKPAADMTITYVNNPVELGFTNMLLENNLVAQRFNSTDQAWNGAPGNASLHFGLGTINTSARTVGPFSVNPTDFYEAWVLVDRLNILPIELLDFNVTCTSNGNRISWETATEQNTDHFSIERSMDGTSYSTIGQLNAAGNSSSPVGYTFLDYQAAGGDVYYRLRLTDNNGTQNLNSTRHVNCTSDKNSLTGWYVNDNRINLQIHFNRAFSGRIEMMNASGKLVYTKQHTVQSGSNDVELTTQGLATGIYVVRIDTPDLPIVQKIFIDKK